VQTVIRKEPGSTKNKVALAGATSQKPLQRPSQDLLTVAQEESRSRPAAGPTAPPGQTETATVIQAWQAATSSELPVWVARKCLFLDSVEAILSAISEVSPTPAASDPENLYRVLRARKQQRQLLQEGRPDGGL
jgi:hypothetical protein